MIPAPQVWGNMPLKAVQTFSALKFEWRDPIGNTELSENDSNIMYLHYSARPHITQNDVHAGMTTFTLNVN